VRTSWVILTGILLVVAGPTRADEGPAGNWKVTFVDGDQLPRTFWLIKLEQKDGKWTGTVPARVEGVPATTVEDLSVTGDRLAFTLKLQNGQKFSFEGKVPKEKASKLFGSFALGGKMVPALLEATKANDFYEANKELLSKADAGPETFWAALDLLRQASD